MAAAASSLRFSSNRMLNMATPRAGLAAQRTASFAPRPVARGGARWYSEAPKPSSSSSPTPGAPPPPANSRSTGTATMLKWSAPALALAAGAFLFLSRDQKKEALGVGPDGVNKLKGSKHKGGATLDGGYGIGGPPLKGKLGVKPDGTKAGSKADYQQVYNAIAAKLDKDENYDDGSYGPVLVRLAWHASGTYDKNTGTGGSNGATMRFAPEANHGANAGLIVARKFMDEIHEQFPWITYSDLWTLGGVVAVQELGGPKIPWRPGRSDREESFCTPDGRLPDADKGPDHLRNIFYRMGFNDQEIVALSGAHALGRCHTDRSGFDGPWQHSPTSFNNEYFNLLINEPWEWKKWKGPKQYVDKATKSLMMLPTDMALVKDKSFKKHVDRYAKDESVFFDEFSKAFATLLELGVPAENFEKFEADHSGKPYVLRTSAEQEGS